MREPDKLQSCPSPTIHMPLPSLVPKGPGRGDQPATFLAQLITGTSQLLTLPLISQLLIVDLLLFFFA